MACKGYDRVHDRVYDSVGDDKSLTENELSGGRCTVEKTDDIVSGEVYDRVPYRLLACTTESRVPQSKTR